jgi:hypothetical protein
MRAKDDGTVIKGKGVNLRQKKNVLKRASVSAELFGSS